LASRHQLVALRAHVLASAFVIATRQVSVAGPAISWAGVCDATEVAVVIDDGATTAAVVERGVAPASVPFLAVGIQDVTVGADVPAGLLVVPGRPACAADRVLRQLKVVLLAST
jgi:hypothetical protein